MENEILGNTGQKKVTATLVSPAYSMDPPTSNRGFTWRHRSLGLHNKDEFRSLYTPIADESADRTFAQHNEVKTFKRPVISLMLLASALSYRAWAQHSADTLSLAHPEALSLLMCICSGENKTRI